MKKVSDRQVIPTAHDVDSPLPVELQEVLGELVGAAREGLMALSVGAGLRLVSELMEREVEQLAGPRGKHDLERRANRHGYQDGSVTVGGRRVKVRRPRVRSVDDGGELPLASYRYFASRDPLIEAVMDRMLVGVFTRKFAAVPRSPWAIRRGPPRNVLCCAILVPWRWQRPRR